MRRISHIVAFAVGLAVASAGLATAGQQGPYRVSDQQLKGLVNRIHTHEQALRKSLERAIDRSPIKNSRTADQADRSMKDFTEAADRLRDRVNDRRSVSADAENLLMRASAIDDLMTRTHFEAPAQRDWQALRLDMNDLARAYGIASNWSTSVYPSDDRGTHQRLTGTYELDAGRSDDPRPTAERVSRAVATDKRQGAYQNLLSRLESPETISIERRGNHVSMASTHGPQVSFEVDGRNQSEMWPGGRTINTRVTFEGDRLRVATTGDRRNDYIATFDPTDDGRSLLVTRTIYIEGLRQPVVARSAYRRTSDQPRWNVENRKRGIHLTDAPRGGLAVPDGTRFVARLDDELRSSEARQGDRWTMTVVSPSQYAGAVVQGHVSSVNAPGRPNGSSEMTLFMDNIRFRDGDTSPFDGVIESMRMPNGDTIRVDHGAAIETVGAGEDSRTTQAVERGVLGATLGALIGAIAGGGKGALIGGAVGAGVGAGTVIVEGRDRFDLQRGTELTFSSGDPRYR